MELPTVSRKSKCNTQPFIHSSFLKKGFQRLQLLDEEVTSGTQIKGQEAHLCLRMETDTQPILKIIF